MLKPWICTTVAVRFTRFCRWKEKERDIQVSFISLHWLKNKSILQDPSEYNSHNKQSVDDCAKAINNYDQADDYLKKKQLLLPPFHNISGLRLWYMD